MSAPELGPEWEPGDPLYSPDNHPYSLYVFNFRDDPTSEACSCGDRASWPEPVPGRAIKDGDELGDLIAWHRANQAASS